MKATAVKPIKLRLGLALLAGTLAFNTARAQLVQWFPLDEGAINATTNIVHSAVSADYGTNGGAGSAWVTTGLAPVPLTPPANNGVGTAAALSLGGTSSFTNTWPGISGNADRSIACWIKTSAAGGGANPTIVSLGESSTNGSRFDFRISANSSPAFLRLECQGTGVSATGPNVADNNWHHVALTYSGTTIAGATLYVDGAAAPLGTASGTTVSINTFANGMLIGDSKQDTGRKFKGLIDDVRVYNTALTLAQIQALALAPAITNSLANQTVECGGNATFNAGIGQFISTNMVSVSTNTYTWFTNGVVMGGATNASMTWNNVHSGGSVYPVVVVASNAYGSATNACLLTVQDTTAPVITLNGLNPMNVTQFGTYSEPGATATDTCAGSVTVTQSGTVNTSVVGAYYVTNTATDGYNVVKVVRTVNVVAPGSPPTVTLALTNQTVQCGGNAAFHAQAAGTEPLNYTWSVNGTPVASGTDLNAYFTNNVHAAGSVYNIALTITNAYGTNSTSASLTVIDTIGPVITITGANPLTLVKGSSYTELGATASDSCAGSVAATPSGTVNTAVTGTNVITYTANDGNGNSSTATRLVVVIPITAVWTNPVDGNWSDSANWTNALVPLGRDDTADFSQVDLTADTTVHVDAAEVTGNLIFGNTDVSPAASWIVDNNGVPANTLTLAASSGSPTITVNALGSGQSATLSVAIAGTNGLTVVGNGALVLANTNTYTGNTLLRGGNQRLLSDDALGGGSLVVVSNSTLGTAVGSTGQIVTNNLVLNAGTTLLLNTTNADLTLAGNLSGAGSFIYPTIANNLIYEGTSSGFSGPISFGTSALGATGGGSLNVTNGATLATTNTLTDNWQVNFNIDGTLSVGAATLSANASESITGAGAFNCTAFTNQNYTTVNFGMTGTLTVSGAFNDGNSPASSASPNTFNQNSGTVNLTSATAGNVRVGSAAAGTYNLADGVWNVTNTDVLIGPSAAPGTVTISGGTANLRGVQFSSFSSSTLTLNGGTLNIGTNGLYFSGGAFTSTINLGAGTLATLGNGGWSSTLPVTLTDASVGTTIDTTGGNISLGGIVSGGGAMLTKMGPGTLTLTNANTYSGLTTLSNGVLVLTTAHAGAGDFQVNDGQTLKVINTGGSVSAQMGNLTLGNAAGPSTLLLTNVADPATPVIYAASALTVNGICTITIPTASALTANTVYPLIKYGSYAGGTLALSLPAGVTATLTNDTSNLWIGLNVTAVTPPVNTTPTNLAVSVSSGQLNLSWPQDHTGWRLLVQTNHLSTGISVNTNDWTTVAGSAATNQVTIPVDATKPTEFYRLVYP